MIKKRVIQAETQEQVIEFVSTYKYWCIKDSSDILSTSNDGKEFNLSLVDAMEIATKRGRQLITIRVGTNESNSRTNDEMIVPLANFNNSEVQPYFAPNQPTASFMMSGQKPLNNSGISAGEMQQYLSGALDRQQKEFELMNKSTLAGVQAEMSKKQAQQEITLLKQMHEQSMEFERRMFERERADFEKQKNDFEYEKQGFYEEQAESKEGIKGFISELAGFGSDWAGDIASKDKKKDKPKESGLNGSAEKEVECVEEEELDFEFEEEEPIEEEEEEEFNILDGVDLMDDEELEELKKKLEEKQKSNTQKTK